MAFDPVCGSTSSSVEEGRLLWPAKVAGKMNAAHASVTVRTCVFLSVLITVCASTVPVDTSPKDNDELDTRKIELFDGVAVKFPKGSNSTGRLMSFEIDTGNAIEEGRKKSNKKVLERILPMFILPFLIQSTIVPLFLSMLKFMLFKSLMVGKLAMGLILLNAFKNHNTSKGRHDVDVANVHYGYHDNGMEEAGTYFN